MPKQRSDRFAVADRVSLLDGSMSEPILASVVSREPEMCECGGQSYICETPARQLVLVCESAMHGLN